MRMITSCSTTQRVRRSACRAIRFNTQAFSGTSWTTEVLPADSVQPGHYYLIGLYSNSQQSGTDVGAALPTPDFQATSATYLSGGTEHTQNYGINMSAQYGKVLLSNSATITPAGTSCPVGLANTVDFVGFGSANCYEGSAPAGEFRLYELHCRGAQRSVDRL